MNEAIHENLSWTMFNDEIQKVWNKNTGYIWILTTNKVQLIELVLEEYAKISITQNVTAVS